MFDGGVRTLSLKLPGCHVVALLVVLGTTGSSVCSAKPPSLVIC